MNAGIYKLIFSKRLNALVVVGEICSSQGKAPGTTRALKRSARGMFQIVKILGMFSSGALLVSTAWATPAPNALPTGGQVVQGSASISQSDAQMDINQASQRAVINWQTFDVGVDAKVHIIQPNQAAVLLNRVVTNKPSEIFGKIEANGQVILVNNNGIVFGQDGSASASSFTATTLDISDKDFMEGKTRYSSNGAQGEIVNHGTIEAKNGGYVALLGAKVTNDGKIITHNGTVALGAADSIAIPMTSSGKIKMQLSAASVNAAVENTKNGVIVTEGGDVYLQAAAANNAMASVKHSGQIDTSGEQAGKAILLADSGEIMVDGSITANSTNAANKGGDIIIGRDQQTGVLAKTTDVSGASLESKKGFVETSAHQLKVDGIKVKAKEWLLDPDDIEITDSALTSGYTSQVSTSTITSALNNGTSITLDTATGSSGVNGNILVTSAINATNATNTDATLTLKANNGIKTNANIIGSTQAGNTGKINVNMTALGAMGNADSGIKITKDIDVTGSLSINGTANYAGNAGVFIAPAVTGGTQTLKAGGDLTITGTSNIIGTGYGVCISSCSGGPYATITNISSTTGSVSITGNTQTSRGVSFGGGTGPGIAPGTHTYNISADKNVEIKGSTQGKLAGSAYGVFENVSAQLNLASTTGSVLIDGDASADTSSTSGQGVGLQGNLSLASASGITISGKGRTTTPSVTGHGAISIATTASPNQLIKVNSGDLVISGVGGGYGLSIGNATTGVGSTTISNTGGKIAVSGKGSSSFGVGFSGTNKFNANTYTVDGVSTLSNGVQLSGTLNIDSPNNTANYIKGTSTSAAGINLANGLSLTATNNLVLNGETASNVGVSFTGTTVNAKSLTVNGKATTTGNAVQLTGTNTLNSAINEINGASNSGTAIYQGGVLNITGSNVTAGSTTKFTGTSTSGKGFFVNNAINATTSAVSIKGESLGADVGVHFSGGSVIQSDSYTVKGASNTNAGVYFSNGASTFKSTSTTVDSLIEGTSKTNANAVYAYNGATINLDSGNGKATMATDANSSGGIRLGYAGGAVVNTKGDITIGSHSNTNAFLMNQGTINALSGNLTLKGKSTSNGIFFQDGGGVGAQLIGTNGAKISLDGISTGSGDGIRLALFNWAPNRPYLISSSGVGGSVTLNGISSQGNGVFTGRAQIISNDGNSINITGKGADSGIGAGAGVYVGEAITANGGGKITINGSTNGGNVGVLLGDLSKTQSMAGEVAITGYSKGGIGAQLQGIVYADKDITVNGNSDSTTLMNGTQPARNPDNSYTQPGYAGLLMQNSIQSKVGNITVTGTTKSLVTQAVQMAALNTTTSGSLTTDASNKTININADSLDVGTTSTVNAGNTGTVNIKTTSSTRGIRMGGSDTNARLGIDNAELSRITAGNLVIGDTNSTGTISFESAVATIAQTGNITLQTGGNIQFGYASGYGSLTVDPAKTLTLNAAGSNSTIKELWTNSANFVKASNLEVLGSNAEVTLANKFNEIGTLSANVKSINLTNKGALTVGTVNNTTGITATNGVSVTTQTGDLSLNESISNTNSGNVVVGAGVSKSAGDSTGGDVKTTNGKTIANDGTGKTYIYSGKASTTGTLSYLNNSLTDLYLDSSTNTQNADSGVAYGATIANGANTQVLFREKVNVSLQQSLSGATLNKTYGDVNTANGQSAALWADMQGALKASNSNNGISNQLTSTMKDANNNDVKFHVSAATVIGDMTGTIQGAAYNSTNTYLKADANGYSYNVPTSTGKYTFAFDSNNSVVKAVVDKRALIGSITAPAATTYGSRLVSSTVNDVNFTNKVVGDVVTATGVSIDTSGKTSTSGNLKADTHTGIQSVSGLTGTDADNYTFANVKGDYKVEKLALTGAVIANVNTVYGTAANTGAVSFANVQGSGINKDKVSADSKLDGAATGLTLAVGAYVQTVDGGLKGDDAGNYSFNGFKTPTPNYVVAATDLANQVDPVPVNPNYKTPNNMGGASELVTTQHNNDQIQKQCSLDFAKECKAQPASVQDYAPRYTTFY